MRYPSFTFTLPDWLMNYSPHETSFPEIESRMRLVIELSRLNVVHETGGPFGAAIFDMNSHRLLAPGVNIVVPARCSILHAEIVAIMMAQRMVGHFNLGSDPAVDYEMVVSTEPCACASAPYHGPAFAGWPAAPDVKMRSASVLTKGPSPSTGWNRSKAGEFP